ncbi:hypothetical protein [Brachybacterium sp. UNK5269]|uniref:hypothetical protein n=1 Tax=Brachybacterium sp. UNK5269 TaxID=3408576 RepID=UPI003BB1B4AD
MILPPQGPVVPSASLAQAVVHPIGEAPAMTTNTSPADPRRRLLDADDPAELLAEARLCLRESPTDALIMVGAGAPGLAPVLTCSSLQELLAPTGERHLHRHLELLRRRGGPQAHALIVVGDGYQDVPEPVVRAVLRQAGELLRCAARDLGPAPFALHSLRAAAGASCWELLAVRDGDGVEPSRAGPLRPFQDTRAAAAAVLTGNPLPHPEPEDPVLAEIGHRLRLPPRDLATSADIGELFTAARTALGRLRAGSGPAPDAAGMTQCEQIAEFLSAVAVDRLHWELLAQCVEHGAEQRIERETLLQVLVSDPRWRPHPDVCAGGPWYQALERLRVVAGAGDAPAAPARGTARSAWRALTALLVMLAWWNHRFATAGGLVDELREREPESTLAPLLSRMTDAPIFPAWWPAA